LPELRLVGAGGEPVDFRRTLASHGVAELLPNRLDEEAWTLETTLAVHGFVRVSEGRPGYVDVEGAADAVAVVRHMLRLDEDLSRFYAMIGDDDQLAWAKRGAGRMLRSPTVFEDVVKTVCTTNCTWAATVRMVTALVVHLGVEGRTFPSPAAMAEAPDSFYTEVARTGYRGPYLRSIAAAVADGSLDLEALDGRSDLPDEEVAERLLALPGVGPYAAAHIMMLLGRYGRLILDSWTRPKYSSVTTGRKISDRTIERRFRRYRDFAGLAFWLFITQDWVADQPTPSSSSETSSSAASR
jgi:3-methyladenine DNA glycosylase/8-oxoguanine DNA glycosylase